VKGSDYSARHVYNEAAAADYEKRRFSGPLGRYRYSTEHKTVGKALEFVEQGAIIADVPCGIGRWWPMLAPKASRIIGVDISPAMLAHARNRIPEVSTAVELMQGEAEHIPLEDTSVDYVFSFALTKHLPLGNQIRVIEEFARVCRHGVISTFSIINARNYHFWRKQKLVESYPLLLEQVDDVARHCGLELAWNMRCTTPIGVEQLLFLRKSGKHL
jgi:ubiquinone/menaquinone biosynthesis C-methylase UbiE